MPEKIYISSTFSDLKQFRQAVVNSYLNLEEMAPGHYSINAMEYYKSEDIPAVTKCLSDVDECDIYILLIGRRYGFIPADQKKSITHLEYEQALKPGKDGKKKTILVFRASDVCKEYNYEETDPAARKLSADFYQDAATRISSEFESPRDLELKVSYALSRPLFKKLKPGSKLIPPDLREILCYCNRTRQILDFREGVKSNSKRVFFLIGDKDADDADGVVKRFMHYMLGLSGKKIDPQINASDVFSSTDEMKSIRGAFTLMNDYVKRISGRAIVDDSEKNESPEDLDKLTQTFLNGLDSLEIKRISIPFYFDYEFEFTDNSQSVNLFFSLISRIVQQYAAKSFKYELYFTVVVHFPQKDEPAVRNYLAPYFEKYRMKDKCEVLEILKPVTDNNVMDWFKEFLNTGGLTRSLYKIYFTDPSKRLYTMEEVNITLNDTMKDLSEGNPRVINLLP
jgi:hypothetical protein